MSLKGRDVFIYLSSGESFKVPKNSIRELDIYEGLDIDEYEINSIRTKAFEISAVSDSLKSLKVRLLSKKQLIDKLKSKGHKKRFIAHAIKYCKDYELIDDKRFAKVLFENLKVKGKSKYSIISELKKAGLSTKLIEKYSNKITDNYEEIRIKHAIRKYYKMYTMSFGQNCQTSVRNQRGGQEVLPNGNKKKDVNKYLTNTLMRKGFNYNKISRLVKKYLSVRKKRGL